MTLISWLIILALLAGFVCDVFALYRVRRSNTPFARVLIAFSLLTLALLLVYAYAVNPYPQGSAVTYGCLGISVLLLASGTVFAKSIPDAAANRLSPEAVRALLPKSITELTPEQMRALIPMRYSKHTDRELRTMILMHLSYSSPATIRTLTPERLRMFLRRELSRSILNS